MRLEPKECRLQALTCERLAQRSTSPIVKGAYAELAKNWLKVADDLQADINARAEPEPHNRRTVNTSKRGSWSKPRPGAPDRIAG
jgi:hypothetical protein